MDRKQAAEEALKAMRSDADEKELAYLGPPENPMIFAEPRTDGGYDVFIPHSHNDLKHKGPFTFHYIAYGDHDRTTKGHSEGLKMGDYPTKNWITLNPPRNAQ